MSSLFGLTYFVALPILVAQWIGVVMVGKGRRGGGWWCMLFGVIVQTLMAVASPVVWLWLVPRLMNSFTATPGGMPTVAYLSMGLAFLSGAGSLLFMIGFALHAMGFRRVCDRVTELEMVIEAQQEQLSREKQETPDRAPG